MSNLSFFMFHYYNKLLKIFGTLSIYRLLGITPNFTQILAGRTSLEEVFILKPSYSVHLESLCLRLDQNLAKANLNSEILLRIVLQNVI